MIGNAIRNRIDRTNLMAILRVGARVLYRSRTIQARMQMLRTGSIR
jgi:hypothetical protein